MKILLVRAPMDGGNKISEVFEALGLGYLASFLRQNGLVVEILDAEFEEMTVDQTVSSVIRSGADIIGITIEGPTKVEPVLKIIHGIGGAGVKAHVTVGGHAPTFAYEDLFAECSRLDSVVLGEGELTFLELVRALSGNVPLESVEGLAFRKGEAVIANCPRRVLPDLDQLPFPARDALPRVSNRERAVVTISGSRGCYAQCTFCSVPTFYRLTSGPVVRYRSPDNLVDEMAFLVREYGVRDILFVDDIFVGPGRKGAERARAFAEQILGRDLNVIFSFSCRATEVDRDLFVLLRQAGLRQVHIGVESAVQQILDRHRKGLTVEDNLRALDLIRELDLDLSLGFIMFDQQTSLEEIAANLTLLEVLETNILRGALNLLQPFKGTTVERTMAENSLLYGNYKEYTYEFVDRRTARLWNIINASMGPVLTVSIELDRIARNLRNLIAFAESDRERQACIMLREMLKKTRRHITREFLHIYRQLTTFAGRDDGDGFAFAGSMSKSVADFAKDSVRMLQLVKHPAIVRSGQRSGEVLSEKILSRRPAIN